MGGGQRTPGRRGQLKGHGGPVRSAAFSPDGARVVTASQDTTARVWEAASGRLVAVLKGHNSAVNSAAFSPDGARVVTASVDMTARVWEAASGRLVAELKGHGGAVNSAAFSPDGARVVTASVDKTARVWEAASGRLVAELKGHGGLVYSAAFSPDGARVVTASYDRTARVWEAASGRLVAELKGHGGPVVVRSAAFSPDGARVVTALDGRDGAGVGGGQRTTRRRAQGPRRLRSFPPRSARTGPASSPPRPTTRRGCGRRPADDSSPSSRATAIRPVRSSSRSAAFSPDGARVVTASSDNTARVWEAASGRLVAELTGHGGEVNSAAFSPDGARVVTASIDGTARVWRLDSLPGEAETLPLWVEVFTGTELQGGGRPSPLGGRMADAPPEASGLRIEGPADPVAPGQRSEPLGPTQLPLAKLDSIVSVHEGRRSRSLEEANPLPFPLGPDGAGVLGEFEDLADDQVAGVVDDGAVELEDLVGGMGQAAC